MRDALPQMLELSRELVAYEARARQAPATAAEVCEKLRPKLSTLMGATGFRALLSRALTLASAQVPSLCNLELNATNTLVERQSKAQAKDVTNDDEDSVVLMAHLLSLLVTFVGEKLTRQILLEIWPQSSVHYSDFETGDSA